MKLELDLMEKIARYSFFPLQSCGMPEVSSFISKRIAWIFSRRMAIDERHLVLAASAKEWLVCGLSIGVKSNLPQ
ncbi:hypothetical protein CEXT_396651 [Caerostris extrusa]|uniref:Uncharacterized protein n=1 Tax=Caerostris extrusa TaxID=172846 RepID=A0AAV4N7T5_CAEEX|nr:hypothetical protein CEXT_396651 [Caerostris extrusa]